MFKLDATQSREDRKHSRSDRNHRRAGPANFNEIVSEGQPVAFPS
jgi:hypothetical protein